MTESILPGNKTSKSSLTTDNKMEEEKQERQKFLSNSTLRNNASVHWPGTVILSKTETQASRIHNYFGKHRDLKVQNFPIYDQTFKVEYGWNQRMHRDDRKLFQNIGKGFNKEECNRKFPILASSAYGRHLSNHLENRENRHLRISETKKFFRATGVGLPPVRKDSMR